MATTISRGIKRDIHTQERLQALAQIRDREKREDQERYEQYLLTGEAVSGQKAAAWLESLATLQKPSIPPKPLQ